MNVLISGNNKKSDFLIHLKDVIEYLDKYTSWKIFLDKYIFYSQPTPPRQSDVNDIHADIDLPGTPDMACPQPVDINSEIAFNLVISLGGDGSILSCVRRMKDKQVPILGIHIGNLGFLNQCNIENYKKYINTLIKAEKINFTKHKLIEANFTQKNNRNENILALNDIVISQKEIPRLLNLDVYVNDILLNNFNADGIIFSSPLGSTAYSLSAGGPIVTPEVDSIILTPISPHALSNRPIVLGPNSIIKVKSINTTDSITVSSDGQSIYSIDCDSITILNTSIYAKMVTSNNGDNYYEKLRNKLGW